MAVPGGRETEGLRRLRAIGVLREAYTTALLAGEESAVERAVREAIDAGIAEGVIDDAIIAPAMRRVGDLWAGGELSVADEHLATHTTIRMVALLRESFRVTERRGTQRILLAGLAEERHVVGLEMAASVLAHGGYEVLMLGPDVPLQSLAPAVRRHRPAIVGLSATLATTASVLPAAIYEIRAADPAVGLLIGGPAASLRMQDTPGTSVCTHVTDAVELADALAQHATLN